MRGILAVFALLFFASALQAQGVRKLDQFDQALEEIAARRYEVRSGLKLTEAARVLYGGYFTFSVLGQDNEAGQTRILRQYDTKLWGRVVTGGHEFYGRLRFRYEDFNSGDSFDGSGDGLVDPVGDKYWYRFNFRNEQIADGQAIPDTNFIVQLGRLYEVWAFGVTLSDTLYALKVDLEFKNWTLKGMMGLTPSEFVDFDPTRPDFNTDTDRLFWGLLLRYEGASVHKPYVYFLTQEDNNDFVASGGQFTLYDSSYVALGSQGQISNTLYYRTEFIYEFGDSASDALVTPQTIEDIEAWALGFELAWVPRGSRQNVRYEFVVLAASGDDDRQQGAGTAGGNTSGTDDNAFNAFGFVYTGLVLAPELNNLTMVRLTRTWFPFPDSQTFRRMNFRADLFFLMKTDEDAPMTVETVPGKSFLGTEVDLGIDWRITSDTSLQLLYGIFIPDDGVPYSDPRHFFYMGVSYAF